MGSNWQEPQSPRQRGRTCEISIIRVYREDPAWDNLADCGRWWLMSLDDMQRLYITSYGLGVTDDGEVDFPGGIDAAADEIQAQHPGCVLVY